jgi:circadian clock protein KaiB
MRRNNAKARKSSKQRSGDHELRLYVAGSGPRSLRAVQNLTRICEQEIPGHYHLEVVDIYKQPLRAAEDQIVAIPTLIKHAPGLVRRMIGDLSELAVLRQGLGL